MSCVVVERNFSEPVPHATLDALEKAAADCLGRLRVRARFSMCARDGLRMICIYEAPDAEAVRTSQDEASLPYDAIWTGRELRPEVRVAPDARYATIVVQREPARPVGAERVFAHGEDPDGCLKRNRVSWLFSFLSLDGRKLLCVFSGPDAESVRAANQQASLSYVRAWPAAVVGCPSAG